MEKVYSYDELASILGCSRTAIAKKVKPDIDNPGVERYKNRYEVVIKDGKKGIKLTDEALEEEKSKSKGFKNVSNKGCNTTQEADIIDVEPIKEEEEDENPKKFTERYIDRFLTFEAEMYNELRNRDKQILLLTTSENKKEEAYYRVTAENKELKQKYNVLIKVAITFGTLFVIVLSSFITFLINNKNVSNDIQNVSTNIPKLQEQVINDKKPAEVQEVVTPPAPQQAQKANVQQKRK